MSSVHEAVYGIVSSVGGSDIYVYSSDGERDTGIYTIVRLGSYRS